MSLHQSAPSKTNRIRHAAQYQVEGLERRLFLSSAIAAFATQQTFATGSNPRSVAVADVNADGKLNLLVANSVSNTAGVMLGNGNGSFQSQQTFTVGTTPFSVAVADVNSDGKADLITANNGSNNVSVLLGNGNGTFQAQKTLGAGANARFVAVSDVNGDGKPDLLIANYNSAGPGSVSVLLGNGNGTFQNQLTFATGTKPSSIAVADFNADGKPDLAIANKGGNSVSILLGNGNGTFQNQRTFGVGSAPFSVAAGDLSQDGKIDLVVADESTNAVSVLLGNGNGTFQTHQTYATGTIPASVAISDVNGDGKLDLVVGNYTSNNMSILVGNGSGTFQPQKTFGTGTSPFAFAVADVNRDGRQDLLVANEGSNSVSELLGDVPPTVLSINRASPPGPTTAAISVSYTVMFNEPVTGVVPAEFTLALTGSVTATTPVVISGSGAVYTVTVNRISGSGTLELNLLNDGTIQDAAGNPLQPGNTAVFPGQTYTVVPPAYPVRRLALFGTNQAGVSPQDTLVRDANGNLYGTAPEGGAYSDGTVFEIPQGSSAITTLASFNGADGAYPYGLTLDASGNLYGTTEAGGENNDGTIFEVAHGSSTITTIASFTDADTNDSNGQYVQEQLTFDSSGNLYGTTSGLGDGGTVFEIPHGSTTLTTIAQFNVGGYSGQAAGPSGNIIIDSFGNIYGTTQNGGANNQGAFYEIRHGTSTVMTLASFNLNTNGAYPTGLVRDTSGNFYGATNKGPFYYGNGTIFEIASGSSTIATLASLDDNDANPLDTLTIDSSGNLYGTAAGGKISHLGPNGSGTGTIFELPHGSTTVTTLASFGGGNGSAPYGGVVFDGSGNIYGTTTNGGAHNEGVVYELPQGSSTISAVASFDGTDGTFQGSVVLDSAGNLFGVTAGGGVNNDGTVYEIPHGTSNLITVAPFNAANGNNPDSLVIDGSGNLYGTTAYGGTYGTGGDTGYGTIFEIPAGTSTILTLADFNSTNGRLPVGLVMDASENLFGATNYGGANDYGSFFELAHGSSTITTLASCDGSNPYPNAGLALDSADDVFDATNYYAGSNNQAAIIELAHGSSAITTVATLSPYNYINTGLVFDGSGNLFGISTGTPGTLFELAKGTSIITTVETLGSSGVYSGVSGPLLMDSGGNIYGASGNVFELPHGSPAVLTLGSFDQIDGWEANSLAMDSSGNFYGTTQAGGSGMNYYGDFQSGSIARNTQPTGAGTVFKLPRLPILDTISGTSGADNITLTSDYDAFHIDWTLGNSTGILPTTDANGLTISGNGGSDVLTLDYSSGNPLPNSLHLNGTFTINGLSASNPLANTTLEIGRSTVYVSYSSSDPLSLIQGYLKNGFNNGAWNGTASASSGVISSTPAAQNALQTTAIGYADSADGLIAGQPANTIELKYTLYGDTALAGTVGSANFTTLTLHYHQTTGGTWDTGDFNYDGSIDFNDFTLLTRTYNTSLGSQAAPSVAGKTSTPTAPHHKGRRRR